MKALATTYYTHKLGSSLASYITCARDSKRCTWSVQSVLESGVGGWVSSLYDEKCFWTFFENME